MLKELEVTGFKSFAKKVTLEFRTSISAIVGPNGSGKSNVAEALRFVLGEQSLKSMRGKRGEDLIFNGSSGAPKSNRASAKIVFDNSRKIFDLDYDEVSIERVVHRDGTNEYFINGSQVRLRDILELLSRANIGASGHHIISQGEADRILSVSPKERKGMIEEALGLKIYQYKKEESLKKLQKTEENIKQVESLRREIAPHLKFLKRQVEKLEKLQSMKEELLELYKHYFRKESLYLKLNKEKVASERREPAVELETLEAELVRTKTLLNRDEDGKMMSELSGYQKDLEDKRKESGDLVRELGRLEGEVSSAEKNLRRQKEFLAREANTTIPLAEVKSLEAEVRSLSAEAENSSDFVSLKGIINSIRALISDFVRRSSGPMVEENELVKGILEDIASLRDKKNILEERLQEARRQESEAEKRYVSKREEIEKEKDSYKDAEREIYRIMARQNELHSTLNSLKLVGEKLALESDEYERELQEAVALVGPEAIRFDNTDDEAVSEEVLGEDRKLQEERKRAIERIKIRLEDQGISGSEDVMKEYKETSERDLFLERELGDLIASASSLKNLITELEFKLGEEFKDGISKINREFKKFFSMMFGGGDAGLLVVLSPKRKKKDTELDLDMESQEADDSEEDADEGIEVNISLPHKKIKGLMMLSGGERALTSIALLFAISQVNPPPFVVLDETDAALDEANSRKYAEMVKALSAHSQVILITHNRETMNSAGVLYGVTMGSDGVSKLLSVSFDEATNYAK